MLLLILLIINYITGNKFYNAKPLKLTVNYTLRVKQTNIFI